MSNKEPSPGPFKSTTTKTIKLSPIEFTVTQVVDSTHVPAPECGCGGDGSMFETILAAAQQAAQAASAVRAADPVNPADVHDH